MWAAVLFGLALPARGVNCPAGKKYADALPNLKCTSSLEFQNGGKGPCSACCIDDPKTCGGTTGIVCADGKLMGSGDTWATTVVTDADKNTLCCVDKPTCAAYSCGAGYKKKANVDNTKCSQSPCFETDCCELDPLKCGGTTGISCAAGKINPWSDVWFRMVGDSEFQVKVDAWKNTACTDSNKNDVCCLPLAKCSAATCPAGYKMKSDAGNCTTMDASSCTTVTGTTGTCCEADMATCGGLALRASIGCSSGSYANTGDDTWKKIAATDATKNANCCPSVATCSSATCPAGEKMKAGVADTKCTGNAASCATTCCEVDTEKCGGLTGITCAAGTYNEWTTILQGLSLTAAGITKRDAWLNKAATEATKNDKCCTAVATCQEFSDFVSSALVARSSQLQPAGAIFLLAAVFAAWCA